VPADDANLVVRARDLLRRMAGARAFPVSIELEKNLPVASGIGGGSSDAAAALRALARLWGLALSVDELGQAGLQLGADLPMCVAARTLRAQGVGEEIVAVTSLPALDMVLVNPGVAVATQAVFGQLQSRRNSALPALPVAAGFAALASWLATTRNDLEAPAIAAAPQIASVLAALRGSGAAFARMSGSGATCFGLYPSRKDAARAAERIAAAQPSWYVQATRSIEPPSRRTPE
jgi:4-diphosphocytidyl-2-C-methyl-D-erythritol kinase